MSKTISFRGTLPIGEQDRIRLKTNNGKTGYKITKFELISTAPGVGSQELVGQIYKTDQTGSISISVFFTNSNLVAVSYIKEGNLPTEGFGKTIIMDNEIVNQDIFVNVTDANGGTTPCNYYIELETMALTDLEASKLTLQSIRTITS
tara:strand:+ start:52 stop:495 length:444 start_codon:yes stop_codon:yes gene_type:complete